jgi:hypothetical protein
LIVNGVVAIDSSTIDRIVANVLQQLGANSGAAPSTERSSILDPKPFSRDPQGSATAAGGRITLSDRVITADLLAERIDVATVVAIASRAILTPSARDFIKERGLQIDRAAPVSSKAATSPVTQGVGAGAPIPHPSNLSSQRLLVVVRNTDAVAKLWTDLQATWSRELLGCPDDAASLAVREIARGAVQAAVILAEQAHRAACLANRSPAVKAVAVRDAGEVAQVRRQLRANVWCIDPTPKSWFELRNLLSAVTKS